MKQRLVYIDQLKGFAILMVVMGHVLQFCFKESEPSLTSQVIVSFHMPLFAFLSGLMFMSIYDLKAITTKFMKQSHKLLLPFLSFLIIYAYTIRPEENMLAHPFKLGLWYLLFLWQCYLITHLYHFSMQRVLMGKDNKRQLAIDVCWLLLTYLGFKYVYTHAGQDTNGILGIVHLYKLYPFFFIGCMIKRYGLFQSIFGSKRIWADFAFIAWITMFVVSLLLYSSQTIVLLLGILSVYPIVLWFYQSGGGKNKIWYHA